MVDAKTAVIETDFSRRFSLDLPLIVAPMAGATTPQLVAESSNAGALGSLACAYMSPEQIQQAVDETTARTSRPFAINLFTPMPTVELREAQIQNVITATKKYRDELGLPAPSVAPPFHPDFDKQFEVVLRNKPAIFSFVFGLLDPAYLKACRERGIYTMGAATTLEEGLALAESGVDSLVAQGTEAGGHRAIFDSQAEEPGINAFDLTRALTAHLKIPVIAAGGIMDGRGIAAALALGTQAAQLGTAFLLCDEASTSAPYRKVLTAQGSRKPALTRAFSGRLARGLPNRFQNEMVDASPSILPFPAQNAFTRDLRNKSTQLGSADFLSLWAGCGVEQIRDHLSTKKLIETLAIETQTAVQDFENGEKNK